MPSAERCSPSVCSLPFTDRTLVGIWSSCSAAACNTPYSARFSPRCIALWARSARIPRKRWRLLVYFINLWQKHGDGFPSPQLYNLLRSPAVRRISHGRAIFHIAQAIFHCALAQFHCGRKPAYIVPVTTTVVTPGVTLTTPVVVSCVNVAAGTASVVAAPVLGRVSTPAV